MRALGFFYDWSGRRTLDPYFRQVAQAFAELGIQLDVILADEFRHPNGGQESLHPAFDANRLAAWVRKRRPDVIFSVNNAGLTAHLLAATTVPVVTWLVDDLPHLFFHDGFGDPALQFAGREHIFCYSSTLAGQVAAAFPHAQDRIGWMPHGTNLTPDSFAPDASVTIPIAFVGSCLPVKPLVRLLGVARRHGAASEILGHLAAMRADYVTGSAAIRPSPSLMRTLTGAGVTVLDYHRTLADALTTQNRVEGLSTVGDLGLHLWGNPLWLDTLIGTTAIAERFQFDTAVTTSAELNAVYARSRISVNIPNVQNCAGLAVRVLDAMASPSLLVTEYHPDSDLFRLFGPDCPVPQYRSTAHLRELCAHYLAHEEERLAIVRACNRLIDGRLALRERVRAMLEAAGIAIPAIGADAEPFRILPPERFRGFPRDRTRLSGWFRYTARRHAQNALSPLLHGMRAWIV